MEEIRCESADCPWCNELDPEHMVPTALICMKHKIWGHFGWLSAKLRWHINLLRPLSHFKNNDLCAVREWAETHRLWKLQFYPYVEVPAIDYSGVHVDVMERDE
jgi:hypothetical protein